MAGTASSSNRKGQGLAQEEEDELESSLAKEASRPSWDGCVGLERGLRVLLGDVLEQGWQVGCLERKRLGSGLLLDINILCNG